MQSEAILILVVSPFDEDHEKLRNVACRADWKTAHCRTCLEALQLQESATIVLCEQELADGDWRTVLEAIQTLSDPPVLIVASRLADARLWGEVLNLGASDLLERPLRVKDVVHAIGAALRWRTAAASRCRPICN